MRNLFAENTQELVLIVDSKSDLRRTRTPFGDQGNAEEREQNSVILR